MSDYKLGIENDKLRALLNDYENELSRTKRESMEKIQTLEEKLTECAHNYWKKVEENKELKNMLYAFSDIPKEDLDKMLMDGE